MLWTLQHAYEEPMKKIACGINLQPYPLLTFLGEFGLPGPSALCEMANARSWLLITPL